jgi:puromycin-sensitive aminopeptidase
MWTSFGLDRSAAFDVDSLHSTRTVEFPVESPADADGMFDVLTYQKGGALLRMLEQYLGPDRFQAGVNHYLTKHSYGNTETNDLWDAIEHVVSTDGGEMIPVRRLMDSWIWQAGYPLVSARVDGSDLVLSQRQFTFDNNPDATLWVIPIHVRIGNEIQKVLLEKDDIRVAMKNPADVVVVNAGGSGFFRVEYSADLMSRISGDTLRDLTTLERYNLVDDAWNAVVAGAVSADRFMAFAHNFTNETDLAVWQAMNKGLVGLGRMLNRDEMAPYNAFIRTLVAPVSATLGAEPVEGEPELTAKLRGLLLSTLAVLGADETAQKRCRDILFSNATTEPELVAAATNVVAATGDAQDYEWFLGRFKDPSTPQDRIRMLYALAEFDDADLMQRTCDLAFSDEVKSQDAPFLITRAIANKYHGDIAWAAAQKNWAYANEKFPGNTIVRMVSSVTTLNTPAHEAQIGSFFTEHPIPQAVKTLEQVLERQRINVALRSRETSSLKSALS